MQLIPLARRHGIAAAGSLAVAVLTGCTDPFSPYWDRGTYHLRYANNWPVPAVVSSGPGASYTEVLGGSLTLRRDHSYQLVVHVREQRTGARFEYSRVYAGTYEHEYRTLYLNWFDARDGYPGVMVANWRDGRVELVVPAVDGYEGVLCLFD